MERPVMMMQSKGGTDVTLRRAVQEHRKRQRVAEQGDEGTGGQARTEERRGPQGGNARRQETAAAAVPPKPKKKISRYLKK